MTDSGWDNYGGYSQGGGGAGFYQSASYDFDAYQAPPAHDQPSYMTPAPMMDPYSSGAPGAAAPDYQNQSDDFSGEPPLLEELGINAEHITQKTLAVLNPFRQTRADVAGDSDLAGPLVFCLAFGSLLLLVGKVHFNYIYGIGVLGCIAIYALLSLMAMTAVSLTVVVSVLGYCILPIVMLSGVSVIFTLSGPLGTILAGIAVLWCATSASKLFVTAFNMEHQQLLVAYPCSLLYAVFALITIF